MPVYNVAPYVERCLLSVMRQSSTQSRILHHSRNRGLSAVRNTGTDDATSDYIYYVDSDDELTQDCLQLFSDGHAAEHILEAIVEYLRV